MGAAESRYKQMLVNSSFNEKVALAQNWFRQGLVSKNFEKEKVVLA